MTITGLGLLDAAIARYPLSTVAHKSPIQSCCEIKIAMSHQEIVSALKEKELLPLPYFISQTIKEYVNQSYAPCDRIYLHRFRLPTGKSLCWALLDKNGMILEQAHSVPRGKYSNYCREIIRHLVSKTPRQQALVA